MAAKNRIRSYMKENGVDIMSLNVIKSTFLDCDENRTGRIPKRDFVLHCAELGLSFPFDFLVRILGDLQEDPED